MPDSPDYAPHDGKDHRLDCWFCGEPSSALAPRHTGGDTDVPCHYVPVCVMHAAHWYDEVPEDDQLPMVPREGVILLPEQAEAALETLRVAPWPDDDVIQTLAAGLRNLRLYGE